MRALSPSIGRASGRGSTRPAAGRLASAPKAPSATRWSRLTRKSTARSTDSETMCIRLSATVAEIRPERRSPKTRRSRATPERDSSARPPRIRSRRLSITFSTQATTASTSGGSAASTPAS